MTGWIEQRSIPEPNSGCWLWTMGVNSDGYGRAMWRQQAQGAHRIAYKIAHCEEIPDGMVVMHKCDVRSCVNPDHLMLGTQTENVADATRKGRMRSEKKRGATMSHPHTPESKRRLSIARTKLPADLILAVYQDATGRSWRKMAEAYGIPLNAVQRIRQGRHFKHILEGVARG